MDESGMNTAMGRSHAWVKRGTEFVDRVPMNWGKNLTLYGAIRRSGWVVLNSAFLPRRTEIAHSSKVRCRPACCRNAAQRRRPGDGQPSKALITIRAAALLCQRHGVRLVNLPPYSPELQSDRTGGWALQKQLVRKHAPRNALALRRIARRARYRVTVRHCRNWFTHAGYP